MVSEFRTAGQAPLFTGAAAGVLQGDDNLSLRLEVDMAFLKTLYYLDANDIRPAFGQGGVVEICGQPRIDGVEVASALALFEN